MEAKIKINSSYFEFLELVQNISKKSNSIQRNLMRVIYQNYDINKVKNDLDKRIEHFDRLLLK
jgi:hypothetical protein